MVAWFPEIQLDGERSYTSGQNTRTRVSLAGHVTQGQDRAFKVRRKKREKKKIPKRNDNEIWNTKLRHCYKWLTHPWLWLLSQKLETKKGNYETYNFWNKAATFDLWWLYETFALLFLLSNYNNNKQFTSVGKRPKMHSIVVIVRKKALIQQNISIEREKYTKMADVYIDQCWWCAWVKWKTNLFFL